MIDPPASLDLFFGAANPAETRVYARLPPEACGSNTIPPGGSEPAPALQLTGTLSGPFCRYAQTLPAAVNFTDLGPGKTLLAQAIVPDACYWTPDLPYQYRARVQLQRGAEQLAVVQRVFGIRPLGARDGRLFYAGKPWVLRAVTSETASMEHLPELREAGAAWYVSHPDEALCSAASEQGVLIVARLSASQAAVREELRRLARHAAVGCVVLEGDAPQDLEPRSIAPNLVFVQFLTRPDDTLHRWAQACLCPAELIAGGLATWQLPLLAHRPAEAGATIVQRRAACDLLQRDLAGMAEVAGYLV